MLSSTYIHIPLNIFYWIYHIVNPLTEIGECFVIIRLYNSFFTEDLGMLAADVCICK